MLQHTRPQESLESELQEVANDAAALVSHLDGANYLPDEFPKDQLRELANSLIELPLGTAEGCRAPLEYARARLPFIRREHILSPANSSQNQLGTPPSILRGELLDRHMRDLIASVTTALDEYRRLASDYIDEDIVPEPSISKPSDNLFDNAIGRSKRLSEKIHEARDKVTESGEINSKGVDDLKRQLKDADGLNRLARAELKMPQVVPGWVRRLAHVLKNYPTIIRATSAALKVGADILKIGLHRWTNFWSNFEEFAIEEFKAVCDSFDQIADRLDDAHATSQNPVLPPGFDRNLVENMIINGQEIPESWRPFVTALSFSPSGLRDIKPLTVFKGLRSLDIRRTLVSDISPIASFENLEVLLLSGANITDIAAIAGMKTLKKLEVGGMPGLKNLDVISNLTSLQLLTFSGTRLKNLSQLGKLPDLKVLDVQNTGIDNLKSIGAFPNLTHLYLTDCPIKDLSPLPVLKRLKVLQLAKTPVVDVAPLALMASLETLNLSSTRVLDISALANISSLVSLDISATDISSIDSLAGLTSLRKLDISKTLVPDKKAVRHLIGLRVISGGLKFR